MELDNMPYEYSLFWNNGEELILLGDHFTVEEAEAEIEGWCTECEDKQARDPDNYIIKKYGEYECR
jgi:hypothetical protein